MRIVLALALMTAVCVLFIPEANAAATVNAVVSGPGGTPAGINGGGSGNGGGANGGGGRARQEPPADRKIAKWALPPAEQVKALDEKRFDALLAEVALDGKQQDRAYELKAKVVARGEELGKQQDAVRTAYDQASSGEALALAAKQVQEIAARVKKFDPDADYRFGLGHILTKEQWAKFKVLEKERDEAAANAKPAEPENTVADVEAPVQAK